MSLQYYTYGWMLQTFSELYSDFSIIKYITFQKCLQISNDSKINCKKNMQNYKRKLHQQITKI